MTKFILRTGKFFSFFFLIISCNSLNRENLRRWVYECPYQEEAYFFVKETRLVDVSKSKESESLEHLGSSKYLDLVFSEIESTLKNKNVNFSKKDNEIQSPDFIISKIKDKNGETKELVYHINSERIYKKNSTDLDESARKDMSNLFSVFNKYDETNFKIIKHDVNIDKSISLQKSFSVQLKLNQWYNISRDRIKEVDSQVHNSTGDVSNLSNNNSRLEVRIIPQESPTIEDKEPLPKGSVVKMGDSEYLDRFYRNFVTYLELNKVPFEKKAGEISSKVFYLKKIKDEKDQTISLVFYLNDLEAFRDSSQQLSNEGRDSVKYLSDFLNIYGETKLYLYGKYNQNEVKDKAGKNLKTLVSALTSNNIPEKRFELIKLIKSDTKNDPFESKIVHQMFIYTQSPSLFADKLPQEIREAKKGLIGKIDLDQYYDMLFTQITEDLKERGISLTKVNDNEYETTGLKLSKEKEKDKTKQLIISFDGDFSFGPGKAALTERAKKLIASMATALNEYQDVLARIHGHTDSTGNKQFNYKVSFDRANTVKNEIVKNYQVNAERFIEVKGFADDRKIEPTNGPSAKNRRVEILLEFLNQK